MKAIVAAFEERVERRFNWVIGIQFTTLFALLAAMASVLAGVV